MSTQTEAEGSPPVARREEDNVCFAGVATADWDVKMPRQSNDSTGELFVLSINSCFNPSTVR